MIFNNNDNKNVTTKRVCLQKTIILKSERKKVIQCQANDFVIKPKSGLDQVEGGQGLIGKRQLSPLGVLISSD